MKDKELKIGIHKAGKFTFSIQRTMFDSGNAGECSFFEVLVSEVKQKYNAYINLVEDTRFNLFGEYNKYIKPIRIEEIIEYNTYVQRRLSNPKGDLTIMPLYRLSQSTLVDLINVAVQIKT